MVGDFADDPKLLDIQKHLFTHGRHSVSVFSIQKYSVLAPSLRLNSSAFFMFRRKNMNEVKRFLEENSAVVGKKALILLLTHASTKH